MKNLFKKITSVLLIAIIFFSAMIIGIADTNIALEAKAMELITYSNTYDKLIKLTDKNNPITYSYTASEEKTICVLGNVWESAILHIEAYSDLNFNNLITEDYTVVPDGDWAAASTPHIYLNLEAEETVYIKAYADNPRDPTLDLNNVTIVLGSDDCIDLTDAEVIPPTDIKEYGWKIFKDAFKVKVNGKYVSPGDFEIVYNGENIEGEYLSPGKHTITIRGIWSAIGSKDVEVEVKAKYICFDCKAVFTNEYDYQNHVAEEKASKEYENACTNAQVEIRTPSITKISYGDSIVLHADLIALPPKWKIVWTSDNNNFLYLTSPDAKTCTIFPASSGDTTFTATVYDEDENIISTDTQKMTSKAGFFDKIIAFFKNLFGATKTIPQMLKDLI